MSVVPLRSVLSPIHPSAVGMLPLPVLPLTVTPLSVLPSFVLPYSLGL